MMAHYAFLDENNIVNEVIVGVDEDVTQVDTDGTEVGGSTEAWENFYGNNRSKVCKRTSINNNFRKRYACIGDTYDAERDAFIAPKPFPSWTLNEETCVWVPPVAYPTGNDDPNIFYTWNEDTLQWIEIIE